MKLIKIQSSKDPLIAQVPELYESAFSEAERTDTERFLWMIDHCQEMSFYAITEDDDFCGMAVVFELGICRYLLYLATLDIHRNKGLGALTLKLLREETNLPIIGKWSLQLMTSHADASPSTSVTVFMLSWRIPES